jgi:3-dehydroquinate dehydratase
VYEGEETERQKLLQLAVKLGADYVDIELQVISSSQALFQTHSIIAKFSIV